jgi:hypothetical protein
MYSHDEVVEASESLYQALCVAYILKGLGDDSEDVDYMRLNDVDRLFMRLIDCPLTVLHKLRSTSRDDDPDPGNHKPVLIRSAGGAK